MKLEGLLTTAQKRDVVEARLWDEGAPLDSRVWVHYDRRFGWDFAVRCPDDQGHIHVIFSTSLDSPRYSRVIREAARAVADVRSGKRREVYRGRGPLVGLSSGGTTP